MPRRSLRFLRAYELADRLVRLVEERPKEECIEDHLEVDGLDFIKWIARPKKQTVLHRLIESVLICDLEYSTGHIACALVNDYTYILQVAEISVPSWLNESDVHEHERELDKLLAKAAPFVVEATFHLLFSDREFLVKFNDIIAGYVTNLSQALAPELFESDGIIARPTYIPTWLRTAIFMRDKGRCQVCHTDLTGTMVIPNATLDHIHPLARGGSNDPTNFQLLCEGCNMRKGTRTSGHVFRTETYW